MVTEESQAVVERLVRQYENVFDLEQMRPLIGNLIQKEYYKGIEQSEVAFNRNFMPDQKAVGFMQKYAFDNIKGLHGEMKDKLRKALSEGIMNREDMKQLATRIQDVMKITKERAELISRTESVRAYNAGHYQGAVDSGLTLRKQWSSQPEKDEHNPCPVCAAMDGQTVEMKEQFTTPDGKTLYLPPAHPRCKCRAIYVQASLKADPKSVIIQDLGPGKHRVIQNSMIIEQLADDKVKITYES